MSDASDAVSRFRFGLPGGFVGLPNGFLRTYSLQPRKQDSREHGPR
jgi:hypothetical protein